MRACTYTKDQIKQSILGKLQRYNGKTLEEASQYQIYYAVASTLRDQIMQQWVSSREEDDKAGGKRLYYISIEFLLGRMLFNNALNLLCTENYTKALTELELSWKDIFYEEPEPGLGNGGLGRLAACFMDSLATLDLPAMGSTIRYEYGLFRQKLTGGQQVELPDDWLENGNVWEVADMENVFDICFEGTVATEIRGGRTTFTLVDPRVVEAVPYDMPAVGYGNGRVNTLRTWRARSKRGLDLGAFSSGDYINATKENDLAEVISKVLYPEDNHYEGKTLRLSQHYFLVSATLQYAMKVFTRQYGRDFHLLPEKAVFHINDTHPGLVIPEMMRLLMDEYGLGWDEAQAITNRCMAYTNHTIMAEALERWPQDLVKRHLPRIYMILEEMNRRLGEKLWNHYPGEWDRIARMSILAYDMVHMANLCVSQSYSINGVSRLHGNIIKKDTFADYGSIMGDKFTYVTNGVTHRRWLMACNPRLAALITESIGESWTKEPERLKELLPFRDDAAFRERFASIKRQNKEVFSEFLTRRQEMSADPAFIFDVQVKRLHEYKRQLLNALHIHVLYNRIMDDPGFRMPPRLFVFGAKASRGYVKAKMIIRYILALSRLIDRTPRAKKMLRVLFVENWNVSAAEVLIPAADLSEQISTAGKEASGTGNMKLMMNGTVTIGTLDGANVEISEAVGRENSYIFGMRAEEVAALYKEGTYSPVQIFEQNVEIRRALTQMIDGTLFPDNPALLQTLYHDLLFGAGGSHPDNYFVLKDFGAYADAQQRADQDYADQDKWLRMAITNTAMSGFFSTDRTISEYNERIWRLK
ncbi:MAG: glycogen/starch/alpha-glucan phosphorylase [Eubacteriales bacterium]|nr:glycogen/starch/alpha-glucan phosphorylase [Eubacteriales bacterium]